MNQAFAKVLYYISISFVQTYANYNIYKLKISIKIASIFNITFNFNFMIDK